MSRASHPQAKKARQERALKRRQADLQKYKAEQAKNGVNKDPHLGQKLMAAQLDVNALEAKLNGVKR